MVDSGWATPIILVMGFALLLWPRFSDRIGSVSRKFGLRRLYSEGLNINNEIKGKNPAYRPRRGSNDPPHAFRPNVKERIDKWCERVETLLTKAKNLDALYDFKKQEITNANEFAVRLATLQLVLSRDYGVPNKPEAS